MTPKTSPAAEPAKAPLATYYPQANEPGHPGPLTARILEVGERAEALLEYDLVREEGAPLTLRVRNAPLGQRPGGYTLGAPAPVPPVAGAAGEEE